MGIHRLRGDDLDCWGMYPAFERRVLDFAGRSGVPVDMGRAALEIRNRFVNLPLAAGYWLFTTDGQEICGHVCGWLAQNMGLLTLFIFNAEGQFALEMRRQWADDARKWMEEIDAMRGRLPYIPMGPPVARFEFITNRDAEAWQEWVERLGFERPQVRTLVMFSRKIEKPVVIERPTIAIPKGLMN